MEAEDAPGASSPDGNPILLPIARAEPDDCDVFGVRIVAGRAFSPEHAGADVAIIDRDLARHLRGDLSPLGRRFRVEPEAPWRTVVGVIDDLALLGPDDRESDFEASFPAAPRHAETVALPRCLLILMEILSGLALAATGAAIGMATALALAGLIRGRLCGVEPTDPATIAGVVVVTLAAAAVACAWPARRALRVDPA